MLRSGTLAFILLCLAACSRRGPSPEFAQASSEYTRLYTDKLNDAYADPAMDHVVELLGRVSPGSSDAQAAHELLKTIADGRAQVKARDEALRKDLAVLNAPPPDSAFASGAARPSRPTAPPPAPDAGAASDGAAKEPATGMPFELFQQRYGDCFEKGQPVNVAGVGLRDVYTQQIYNRCQDTLPNFQDRLVIVDAHQVLAVLPKSALQPIVSDAGPPPQPVPPRAEAADAAY